MKELSVAQAAQFVGGMVVGDSSVCFTGVSNDSRTIPAGCLFVPLRGVRFDGHRFLQTAVEQGAGAVLSAEDVELPVPVIRVEDTGKALLALAGGYRSLFDIPVVGITGSVGKTTTKEMTAAVLGAKYRTLYTQGNLNNEIGVPLTLFRLEQDTQAAVIEMGMNHFEEIARMTVRAQPTVAVITNIGVCHIEFLGSREGICKAKLEILQGLRPGGTAVLNGDEPLLWNQKDDLGVHVLTFGIDNPDCDVRAENIRLADDHVSFTVRCPDGRFDATIYTAGRHNVYNALAACAAGVAMGLTPEQMITGLASFRDLHQDIYQKDGYTIIDACYNASPDSVKASLDVLQALSVPGRRWAALGGMLELGSYADTGHYECGVHAAKTCDGLYLYGDGAEQYRAGALDAGMPPEQARIFNSHETLAQALRQDARVGDALLFKGSHGWHMEQALQLFVEHKT